MAFIVRLLKGAAAAHGVKVHVGFTSAFGGMSLVEYTDWSGHAIFESPEQGLAEIHVDGVSYGAYDYTEDGSVTLNLDSVEDDEPEE